MPLSDDPWIAKNSIIDPERMHALGMISLTWNHCERNLFFIFCVVFKLTQQVGWIVAHDMGDVAMCDKIKEMLKILKFDADIDALIKCSLETYDKCRQNRNSLTHFTAKIPLGKSKPDEAIFVRMKGPPGQPNPLPSSLEDIRRIAFETQTLSVYLWKTYKALLGREQGLRIALPPLIAAPDLLWKSPPQTPLKPKRPPRPSPASRRKPK
jgi:hypothetical protein